MANAIVTVTQLCRFVKSLLEEQKPLADLLVRGEVSSVSYRSASGHLYFTLADGESTLRCVMFSRYAAKLTRFPEEGSLCVVRGTVTLYERDSSFQLLAYDLQELGDSARQQTQDELKKRLAAEGLFADTRKRPLPRYPTDVGVITSPEGAALQDILATFRQHNPLVRLHLYPATVQGATAATSVRAALSAMVADGLCQSCVIARGGGSSEDLSAFGDETLVRAVAACPVPVVSAVGHEVDFSLLDLVADARAATPTAACRLLAAPAAQLSERVLQLHRTLDRAMDSVVDRRRRQLERLTLTLNARSPEAELKKNRQTVLFLVKSLEANQSLILERLRRRTLGSVEQLELVNPARLLRRGYSITSHQGRVLSSCHGLQPGDQLTTRIQGGTIASTIVKIEEES